MTHTRKVERGHTVGLTLLLQLFAEGGGGSAGNGGGTGDGAPGPGAQGSGTIKPEGMTAGSDETAGKAEADSAGMSDGDGVAPDYDKEFEDFMRRPEMRERMDKRTKSAIRGRFKSTEAEARNNREMTEFLAARYGVDAGDHKALMEAIEADRSYDRQRAEEAGMSEEAWREMMNLRAKNSRLEARDRAEEEARRSAAARLEATKLARKYPDFDLDTYMADEGFVRMLNAGVDMESAYVAKNHTRLISAAAKYATREAERSAEEKVTATVRANRARPVEGGAKGGTPAPTTMNFAAMSDAEFKALRERARNGERIIFA